MDAGAPCLIPPARGAGLGDPLLDAYLELVATHGRWQWITSGAPSEFEDVTRYTARRIRDRPDRPLLIHYLAALGIPADDDNAYSPGTLVQHDVAWPIPTQTRQEARTHLDL